MTEIFSNDKKLYSKPRDIIYDIVYAKPSDSIPSKWKCLLRQFDSCPKYIAPEFECSCTNVASRIKFNIYQLFSTYSVHRLLEEGKFIYKLCDTKIQCRNILIFKVLSNGSFIYDVYLSTLKNDIYYIHYSWVVRGLGYATSIRVHLIVGPFVKDMPGGHQTIKNRFSMTRES